MHLYKKSLQEIWKSGKRMFRESPLTRWSSMVSCTLIVASFVLPAWRMLPLAQASPFIALHYNIYLGVDRFGPVWRIFLLPVLGLLFYCVNLFIQARSFPSQKTLSLFFAAATPLIEWVFFVATALIVLINL